MSQAWKRSTSAITYVDRVDRDASCSSSSTSASSRCLRIEGAGAGADRRGFAAAAGERHDEGGGETATSPGSADPEASVGATASLDGSAATGGDGSKDDDEYDDDDDDGDVDDDVDDDDNEAEEDEVVEDAFAAGDEAFFRGVLNAASVVPADQGTERDVVLPVHTVEGVPTGETVVLPGRIFDVPLRVDIVHRVVVWQRNKKRRGMAKTKTRGEVHGTTRKARAQKGGGRARVGALTAPHMRGGGVAHGPVLRKFNPKLQRKVRRLGLKVALSAKAAEGRIVVVDSLHERVEPRTKWFNSALDKLLGRGSLAAGDEYHSVLMAEIPPTEEQGAFKSKRKDTDRNDSGAGSGLMVPTLVSAAKRASKNLPYVHVMNQCGLNVYDIIRYRSLAITPDALEALVARLDKPIKPRERTDGALNR